MIQKLFEVKATGRLNFHQYNSLTIIFIHIATRKTGVALTGFRTP